jgi:uncharacterized membrane protein
MDTPSKLMVLLPVVWPLLLEGLLLQVIPDLMRPGLFFGVTVEPAFRVSAGAHAIRRRFTRAIWLATSILIALGAGAVLAGAGAQWSPGSLAGLLREAGDWRLLWALWILQATVASAAYVRANRAARAYAVRPPSVVHVELAAPRERTALLVTALAVPIVSLIVLAAWTLMHWQRLPARLPVHWSFSGPDHWVDRTPRSVATLLGSLGAICLALAMIGWGVLQGSRRIAAAGEAARRERRFRLRSLMALLVAEYFMPLPAWAALLRLPARDLTIAVLVMLGVILVLVAGLLLGGQGGARGLEGDSGVPLGDRTDDRYWTGGLLYFNREDPALLVEKRLGVGYTLNFAHPLAWVILTLIASVPVIVHLL